jgi:hypothetical protein
LALLSPQSGPKQKAARFPCTGRGGFGSLSQQTHPLAGGLVWGLFGFYFSDRINAGKLSGCHLMIMRVMVFLGLSDHPGHHDDFFTLRRMGRTGAVAGTSFVIFLLMPAPHFR